MTTTYVMPTVEFHSSQVFQNVERPSEYLICLFDRIPVTPPGMPEAAQPEDPGDRVCVALLTCSDVAGEALYRSLGSALKAPVESG